MITLIIAAITDDFENFHNYTAIILGTLPAEFTLMGILMNIWDNHEMKRRREDNARRRANGEEDPLFERPKLYY